MLDPAALTPEQRALIGNKPVLEMTLTAGSRTVSDFGTGSVEVKMPYTPAPGEDPEAVVVWYLNDNGVLEAITGRYDAESGSVVFSTDHFSKFVVGTLPFEDVGRSSWYFDDVSFAYANNLFSGVEEARFAPDTSMTRGMLVTVLWRMEKEPEAGESGFTDVKAGEWYTDAVVWASAQDIVSGYGNGLFGPNDVVTREQAALILRNFAAYKNLDVSGTAALDDFLDIESVSGWAETAVGWAFAQELLTGTGNGLLDPKGSATRSQVAAILRRYMMNVAV